MLKFYLDLRYSPADITGIELVLKSDWFLVNTHMIIFDGCEVLNSIFKVLKIRIKSQIGNFLIQWQNADQYLEGTYDSPCILFISVLF
jgi:hypothetical protein